MIRLYKLFFILLVSCITSLSGMRAQNSLIRAANQVSLFPGAPIRQTGALETVVRDAFCGGLIKPSLIGLSLFVLLAGREQLLDIWKISIGMSCFLVGKLMCSSRNEFISRALPLVWNFCIFPFVYYLLADPIEDPHMINQVNWRKAWFALFSVQLPFLFELFGFIFEVANNYPTGRAVVCRNSARLVYGIATVFALLNSDYLLEKIAFIK